MGAQDACIQIDPDKPVALRHVDFTNGGVDIICVDSIDDHGDVNLNGISHEVADAVLFTNYFIFGLSVFQVNIDGQIAATDVNMDGIYLSVADLVGLVRITNGDLLPWKKPAPMKVEIEIAEDGLVSAGGNVAVGAAHLIVKGETVPQLTADNMEMIYHFDGSVTRILVYSLAGNSFSGEFLRIDGALSSIELADQRGAELVCRIVPGGFELDQNYPNPFNPSTNISFHLPAASDYRLTVYNVAGQRVAVFDDYAEAGRVEIVWDGAEVSSGVYFYRLEAGHYSATRKMVLLK